MLSEQWSDDPIVAHTANVKCCDNHIDREFFAPSGEWAIDHLAISTTIFVCRITASRASAASPAAAAATTAAESSPASSTCDHRPILCVRNARPTNVTRHSPLPDDGIFECNTERWLVHCQSIRPTIASNVSVCVCGQPSHCAWPVWTNSGGGGHHHRRLSTDDGVRSTAYGGRQSTHENRLFGNTAIGATTNGVKVEKCAGHY